MVSGKKPHNFIIAFHEEADESDGKWDYGEGKIFTTQVFQEGDLELNLEWV